MLLLSSFVPLHPQYNKEGEAKVMSTSLFSVAAAKVALKKQVSDAEAATKTLDSEQVGRERKGSRLCTHTLY